jgi:hypothetical protein
MRSDSGLEVGSWSESASLDTGTYRQAAEASCSGLLMQLPNGAAKNLLVQGKEEVKQITGR